MICGLIYLKIVPSEDDLSWIRYCNIFHALPDPLQEDIKSIVDDINVFYKKDIIIPLRNNVQNGCVVRKESVIRISTTIFNRYNHMMLKYDGESAVRLVYSVGKIIHLDVESVHTLSKEKLVMHVGRYLDEEYVPGIFKI